MKRLLFIIMLFVSIAVQGQELMSIIDIKPKDTIAYGYVYNDITKDYQRVFVFWDKCQPELNNYLNIIKSDYKIDTIFRVLYQNVSMGGERFIINDDICVYWNELSPQLQASIVAFGNKYYMNYKQGFYYEN